MKRLVAHEENKMNLNEKEEEGEVQIKIHEESE